MSYARCPTPKVQHPLYARILGALVAPVPEEFSFDELSRMDLFIVVNHIGMESIAKAGRPAQTPDRCPLPPRPRLRRRQLFRSNCRRDHDSRHLRQAPGGQIQACRLQNCCHPRRVRTTRRRGCANHRASPLASSSQPSTESLWSWFTRRIRWGSTRAQNLKS